MASALKILTVDDEHSVTQSMRYIFSGPHYNVTGTEGGEEALAILDAEPDAYDVIIIDERMPRITGLELVHEIRKRPYSGKIMILSAHLSPDIREAYAELDVDVMLDKPFNIQELRRTVDQLAA